MMKTQQNVILWIAVVALTVHAAYLSHKISSMSDKSDIQHLRVRLIELVQPDGTVAGHIHAGLDGGSPEFVLRQKELGNYFTAGFNPNGTGPCIEMISGFSIGEEPAVRVELGSYHGNQHGIQITGGATNAYPPLFLSWVTDRATEHPNQYRCYIPGQTRK